MENKPSVGKQSFRVSGGRESSSRTGSQQLATNATTPPIQSVMTRVCVVSLLTGPKYQNIIANVEATELGFLLESFNPAPWLPFCSHKPREPRYSKSVPQKTDFQLLDPTPSIPSRLFWIPTGYGQQHKQRAPPFFLRSRVLSPFHSFNLGVSGERLGSLPFTSFPGRNGAGTDSGVG